MKEKVFKSSDESTEIDITPMLDVVFIMLIFFVVTASFVKEEAIDFNSPPPNSNESPKVKPISLMIDADNQISIDSRNIDVRSVRSIVLRLKAEKPQADVAITVDGQANTKTVIAAVDAIRSANIEYPSIRLKAG